MIVDGVDGSTQIHELMNVFDVSAEKNEASEAALQRSSNRTGHGTGRLRKADHQLLPCRVMKRVEAAASRRASGGCRHLSGRPPQVRKLGLYSIGLLGLRVLQPRRGSQILIAVRTGRSKEPDFRPPEQGGRLGPIQALSLRRAKGVDVARSD